MFDLQSGKIVLNWRSRSIFSGFGGFLWKYMRQSATNHIPSWSVEIEIFCMTTPGILLVAIIWPHGLTWMCILLSTGWSHIYPIRSCATAATATPLLRWPMLAMQCCAILIPIPLLIPILSFLSCAILSYPIPIPIPDPIFSFPFLSFPIRLCNLLIVRPINLWIYLPICLYLYLYFYLYLSLVTIHPHPSIYHYLSRYSYSIYLIGPLPWKGGSVPRFNWFQLVSSGFNCALKRPSEASLRAEDRVVEFGCLGSQGSQRDPSDPALGSSSAAHCFDLGWLLGRVMQSHMGYTLYSNNPLIFTVITYNNHNNPHTKS